MSKPHQLSAEQWRVIGHLYNPSLLSPASRRRDPSMATVCKRQDVNPGAVIEVVNRGLVHTVLEGTEVPLEAVRRLPDKAIRLRITQAGIYHASHDPQHVVLCALRGAGVLSAYALEHTLVMSISFGELCDIAERGLIATHLGNDGDTEVNLRDWSACSSFVYARLTRRGRTFIAYP